MHIVSQVTGLLVAIVTKRALLFDYRGGGIFGLERASDVFARPVLMDLEMFLSLVL